MRTVPNWLLALGSRTLPESLDLDGEVFKQTRILKNDFFAVTAVYASSQRSVILKVGRQASLFGFPMRWVGRLLADRECRILSQLQDLPGIPRHLARWEDTGFIREFVPGQVLVKGQRVHDEFFAQLHDLLDRVHGRGIAVVDLEKCENVLVGTDGHPYLFDFQISWYLSRRWGGELRLMQVIRRRLQIADRYHLVKLQRRTRPDQLPREVLAASYQKPWYVRAQGFVARPLTWVRRRLLQRLDPRRRRGERGWVADDSTMEVT